MRIVPFAERGIEPQFCFIEPSDSIFNLPRTWEIYSQVAVCPWVSLTPANSMRRHFFRSLLFPPQAFISASFVYVKIGTLTHLQGTERHTCVVLAVHSASLARGKIPIRFPYVR